MCKWTFWKVDTCQLSRARRPLFDVSAAGIAALLVTHDQEEALSIADRVAVMRDGRLVQIAPPRELYDTPADEGIARFVGDANLWRATVAAADQVRTPVGLLACDTKSFDIGDAVVVLVRPENVVPMDGAGGKAVNSFSGEIVADRFLGAARRLDPHGDKNSRRHKGCHDTAGGDPAASAYQTGTAVERKTK